ncbi:peptidase M16 [Lawsonia intracellularis]|uniref:insulinase family protein n=1 Tax=Lawsonia intracellularis TaxID=29546 RepID=UPI000DE1F977|nr:insulinase family protein [Lawsonia intracellularis]RBN34856.1 peptidase M16 [Lawsonia intracellularis]RBN35882.1 peptidase M16 [Lawsonia intracellularis]
MNTHYTLIREVKIPEVSGIAKYWRHNGTNAEILSISNNDENKCFGVTFRTPPHDSTGVAHILEHSVLCGSKKYPIKEPFVELLKGSLQTFLNAFTFPDKTCYPIASANLQDFYNLIDVYLDAVFFPLITKSIFQQEGWHIEIEDTKKPLTYKGVVFNEMKGVYSSPDAILMEKSQQSLFPNMLYSLDSGGDPKIIPQLTYEKFIEFHSSHYHPSNAWFFFWGDDPEEERLMRLLPILSQFTEKKIDSTIPLQSYLQKENVLKVPYATGEQSEKGHITFNWLLCPTTEADEILLLEILEHILLGLPGSPLRKVLIESGLGEDVTGVGFEKDLQQTYFSVGLRSINPESSHKIEKLILQTLEDLSNNIPTPIIDAAINSIEFSLRENNSGKFPRGLTAMLRSLRTWLYDADPLIPLRWEKPLSDIKQRHANGEKIFEKAIRKWFIENKHKSIVTLIPDSKLAEQRENDEQKQLKQIKDSLSELEVNQLIKDTITLQENQQCPDTPEALATIPSLTLKDLPPKNAVIPCIVENDKQITILKHPIDTSGIVYVECLFSLDAVPDDLLYLVPLFGRCLTELGTHKHSFVELGVLLASKTGGIDISPLITTTRGTQLPVAKLCISGKATEDHITDLFSILEEILLETQFDLKDRFLQMALEERARIEQALIPAGHNVVITRLRSPYSIAGQISENIGGVSYLEALRNLTERIHSDWHSIHTDLTKLQQIIINKQHTIFNITASETLLLKTLPLINQIEYKLPYVENNPILRTTKKPLIGEILQVPSQVNYVGKGCNIYELGYKWNGSAHVITRHLRMAWLWDQVRVQGGAYGVFCTLDRMNGSLTQVSYRDPNVERTIKAFDQSANYLKNLQLTDRELTRAIVGAIGDLDSYMLPDAKGMASLTRYLTDDQDEIRQHMREEILSTTKKQFTEFAEVMAEVAKTGSVCILGGSAATDIAQQNNWVIHQLL